MSIISKKIKLNKKIIFINSKIGVFHIFFIDKTLKIPTNVKIYLKNKNIFFKGFFGILLLKLNTMSNELFLYKNKNNLILILKKNKKKKSILNLYHQLLIIKIKGVSKNFKFNLILKGVGFKSFIENLNILKLKIGYSHSIKISVPFNIQIISQGNNLICNSNDLIILTQFIHSIKNFKKPEPYKGKGILLKTEKILLKEGKKSKK